MSLETLREEVKATVFDSSVEDDRVDELLNEGLRYTAGIVLLKDCETSALVTTIPGINEVALPSNFSRNLYQCRAADGSRVTVYATVELLEDNVDTVDANGVIVGPVDGCAISGSYLRYGPTPAEATSLTIRYYRHPTELVRESDEPTELAVEHRSPVLANYARWRIFHDIEDGQDGVMVNTNKYKALYFEAVGAMDGNITQGQSRPQPRKRRGGWI